MSKLKKTVKEAKGKIIKNQKSKKKKKKAPKISYNHKPEDLTLEEWQAKLRWQFGETAEFAYTNVGNHPVFSDFELRSIESAQTYNVALRMPEEGGHTCTCMDFKTNRLGVCKHISFVFHKVQKQRGNKTKIKTGFRQEATTMYLDYKAGRQIKLSIGTENEEKFRLLVLEFFNKKGSLKASSFGHFEKIIKRAKALSSSFILAPDVLEFVLKCRADANRKSVLEEMKKFPKDLVRVQLYPYQQAGVLFAVQAGRSLIADEMGLGKTVQAVTAAELFKRLFNIESVLIVCPTSLKFQWKSEIEKLIAEPSVAIVEGGPIARRKFYKENNAFYTIAGYHTIANDLDHFNDQEFDLVILDEAQRIKNWKTKTSTRVKQLNSPYALVLTGTPIENKLEELYSIMQFIDQFRLPPLYSFLDKYQIADPESGKVIGYQNLSEIKTSLSDVLLRRTRKTVALQLPGRSDKTLMVPMTKEQMDIHQDYKENVSRIVTKWRRMKFLSEADRLRLLTSLSSMRMVCDSTYILDQKTRHDTKIDELMSILEEYLANDDHEKVVIFSQWQRMLNLVEQELIERKVGYRFLHGSVPSKKRGELFDSFKNDPNCLVFISTDAGGVGLNLQNASLVVNLDIPWNPAILEQRIARVYRMGQKRRVQVINLVSSGTIEHDMLHVLKFKAGVAEGVLDDGEDMVFAHESRFSKFMGTIEDLTDTVNTGEAATETQSNVDAIPEESPNVQEEILEEKRDFEAEPKPESGRSAKKEPYFEPDATPSAAKPSQSAKSIKNSQVNAAISGQQHGMQSTQSSVGTSGHSGETHNPMDLVQTGLRFMTGLAETLSDPNATRQLVESITEKDANTGQTYLRIPVESSAAVEGILGLLGGLFKR